MEAGSSLPTEPSPKTVERAIIARSVLCVRCRYDLRGLEVDGPCPECGLEIWESVQDVVDPTARAMPRLSDPRGVGSAMVWLTVCLLVASVLLLARPVAQVLAGLGVRWKGLSGFESLRLYLFAAAVLAAASWSVWRLAPPSAAKGLRPVRRDIRLLGAGLLGGILVSLALWGLDDLIHPRTTPPVTEPTALAVVLPLLGIGSLVMILDALRGVILVIGDRSRQFRTARGGRQRMKDMIAAAIGVAVGVLLRAAGSRYGVDGLVQVGTVFIWICTLMLVIGECYMVVNALWIRRSLHRPPPALREILRSVGHDDTDSG